MQMLTNGLPGPNGVEDKEDGQQNMLCDHEPEITVWDDKVFKTEEEEAEWAAQYENPEEWAEELDLENPMHPGRFAGGRRHDMHGDENKYMLHMFME